MKLMVHVPRCYANGNDLLCDSVRRYVCDVSDGSRIRSACITLFTMRVDHLSIVPSNKLNLSRLAMTGLCPYLSLSAAHI